MNVAILGGGIAGLTAAYRLMRQGADVTVFEASDRLGGLGTWFEYDGLRLDRFYHVILDSDAHLLGLIDELGLTHRLAWSNTTMGFIVRGEHYPFNTPMDLLRFGALSLPDRFRTGLAALYITKIKRQAAPLDDELAQDWLRKLFGPRVYRDLWEPLLIAKFGDLRDRVPAYWIWNTLNREKNGGDEVKAAMQGGLSVLTDSLADSIRVGGGDIRMKCPVDGLWETRDGAHLASAEGEQEFDAVISTLPLPLLRDISDAALSPRVPMPGLAYQGVVNVLLMLNQRLDRHYWTAVVESDFSFQGVVETTHVIRPEWIGGRHMVYAMNYCSARSACYNTDNALLIEQACEGLGRLYDGFHRDAVEAAFVFRAPHVEPVWPRGYLRQRPGARVEGTRLFLATTAQAYPMVTSWNTSVKLADDAVAAILASDLGTHDRAGSRIGAGVA